MEKEEELTGNVGVIDAANSAGLELHLVLCEGAGLV